MAGGSNGRIYVRETSALTEEVVALASRWTNLADERLGAATVSVSDEFYAPAQRLLQHQCASYYFHDEEGMRYVDGWETSRRRHEGFEHCVVRLGRAGRISALVFDTSYFTGNFPVGVELSACFSADQDPGTNAAWTPLTGFVELAGNAQLVVPVGATDVVYSHIRLKLHPDGGMARLRVFGEINPALALAASQAPLPDLAALENGGRIVDCNDRHFGAVTGMIAPGPSIAWGKGWETRRRRSPGSDWAIVALAVPGVIEQVEIDTSYYLANHPDRFSLHAVSAPAGMDDALLVNQSMYWPQLLAETALQGGSRLVVGDGLAALGPVTHVRLNIFPDGGVTRLRLRGRPAKS